MLTVAALTDFRPDTFGSTLVRLRTDANLSQRRLGELAGVSNTAISELEKGDAPAPHPSMLMKLAQGLVKTGSGHVDEYRADAHYLTLMRAAGYLPEPRDDAPEAMFRAELEAALGPDNAPLMELLLVKLRGRPPSTQRAAIAVADVLLQNFPSK